MRTRVRKVKDTPAAVPITIKDVARRAHVSHSTVSRALRDDASIPSRTAGRIKRLASQMGYVPSAAARSLKTSHSRALGVVVTNIADPFLGEVVRGLEDTVREAGYSLFLASSYHDRDREQAALHALTEHRVEGVFICSSQVGQRQLRQLDQSGVPIVLVNNQVPGNFAHRITHDDFGGALTVTRFLIGLGHRCIAYLGNRAGGQASQDRHDGYRVAVAEAGLKAPLAWRLFAAGGRPIDGVAGAEAFLRLDSRPTALVCFNDMLAFGVLHQLKAAGLRIPQDVSVTGFDDVFLAPYADPALTTYSQPKYQLGRDAAVLLLELLGGAVPAQPHARLVQGELTVRASTAAPP